MLSAKRLREHAGLFAALLGVVALVSGLSVGVVGFLAQSADVGVRAGLASRAGADLALRASLALDADAAKQDEQVRAAIARSFPRVTFAVDRTIAAVVDVRRVIAGVPAIASRIEVESIPDLAERADLVDGAWPTGPDQVTLQADGAELLGIAVGDTLVVGTADVTVSGTWRVSDALDPRWMGDVLEIQGSDTGYPPEVGLIIVDESLWPRLDSDPRARWTLVPDISTLKASDLAPIVATWDSLGSDWRGQVDSQLITLEKGGRLKRTAIDLGSRVDGLQAIQPVVLLLLVAIALVTLAELGRLLTTTRSSEIALLWSRGASALDVARTTALEVVIAGGSGAVLGTAVALGALALLVSPQAIGALGIAVWVFPLLATLAATVVVAGSAFRSARRQTVRDPSEGAGRARRLAGPGVVVLAVAAAALSVWQLALYGSPLTPTADGGTDVDPIAVMAPALTLIAVVLISLVAFPRIAMLAELASRRSGLLRALAARTVARQLQLVAAPLVVVAVAASTLTLAAAYSATWSDSFSRTSALRAGAPLHVSTGFSDLEPGTISEIGGTAGVRGIAVIDLETLSIGGDTGSIVAATPVTVAKIASAASGSFDRNRAATAMAVDLPGPELPEGTSEVTLTTAQSGLNEIPAVSLQVLDGYGILRELVLGDPVDTGPDATLSTDTLPFRAIRYTAQLPAELASAPGPLHVMTVDVKVSRAAVVGDATGQFALSGLDADGAPLQLDKFWLPESAFNQYDPRLVSNYNGLGFTVGPDALAIRMTPTFDDDITDRVIPPVVVSQQLADRYGLEVGDRLTFSLEAAYEPTNATIARITPAIPGADFETAVLIDLGYVVHEKLRLNGALRDAHEFWVDTADPDAVVASLRPLLPPNTRMETADDQSGRTVLGSAAIALWLGALGCLVLAIITVVAVVRAQLRARRLDVVVLRAIGFGSHDQAGVRRRELGLVLGFGGLTGLVAGAVVSIVTVPQLARAAVVAPYSTVPTPLLVDLVALGAGLLTLVVAMVLIVMIYSARVATQARTAIGAEEIV